MCQINILMSVCTQVLLATMRLGELFLTFPEAAISLVSGCSLHEKVLDSIIFDHDKLEAICLFYILRGGWPHPLVYSVLCSISRIHDVKSCPHVADYVL